MSGALVAIVDDDDAIRRGLSSLLRSAGYAVRLFASAEDYLIDRASPRPDCVLTDVQMPGMSGLDLQDSLAKSFPETPVLIMTAFPTLAIEERATAAGARSFLSKPFDPGVLLQALQDALATGADEVP